VAPQKGPAETQGSTAGEVFPHPSMPVMSALVIEACRIS